MFLKLLVLRKKEIAAGFLRQNSALQRHVLNEGHNCLFDEVATCNNLFGTLPSATASFRAHVALPSAKALYLLLLRQIRDV